MHIDQISFSSEKYPTDNAYPFDMPVFRETKIIPLNKNVTFFIGENGSGKSTLLKALAYRCRIHIWEGIQKTRYQYSPYEDKLYKYIDVNWTDEIVPGSFFSVENFRSYSQTVDSWAAALPSMLDEYGGRSLVAQSHGQSLMAYFTSRYNRKGLYLLDEPETALSPKHQIELLNLIHRLGKNGDAQFIIATHSPILLACLGADIFCFDRVPVGLIEYEQTEYYRVYKEFLSAPETFIN